MARLATSIEPGSNLTHSPWLRMTEALARTAASHGHELERSESSDVMSFFPPLLWRSFRTTAFFEAPGAVTETELLNQQWNVVPKQARLFHACLDVLAQFGVVRLEESQVVGPHSATRRQLDDAVERLARDKHAFLSTNPDLEPYLRLLETCVDNLPAVLDGSKAGTDVLFPNGSLELVEGIYRGNRVSDYFNQLLAQGIAAAVEVFARRRSAPERITVLELGAGTGGSSIFVLEALRPWADRVTYLYTDVSTKFLLHARRHFVSKFPFVLPLRFNLEQPPTQELPRGGCDIVFATNVLHATTNIARTLGHIAQVTANGGFILLNEPTRVQPMGTLTFGLLDGWWLYEDPERRMPHSPLLSQDTWARELSTAGFRSFRAFGAGKDESSPQHVLAAKFERKADPSDISAVEPARFGPFSPTNAALFKAQRQTKELSERKRAYLTAFTNHFCQRRPTSKAHAQAYRDCYADQRAIAFFHPVLKELCFPLELARAEGVDVWDVDGNQYVDVAMDFGCNLFGHRPDFIRQALKDRLRNGLAFGMRPPSSSRAAELLCKLTGHERAVFTQSGTEAVMTAIRLARHATRRHLIVIFSNSYHGHSDGVLAYAARENGELTSKPITAAVPPAMIRDVAMLDYNVPESIDWIRAHRDQLAAVVVEPVQSRRLDQRPGAFLRELGQVTTAAGIALIFDEMITGFRMHPGGAQAWFGVRADLCTYGKVLGGGIGQGAIAGSARFLDPVDGGFWRFGDDSFPPTEITFCAGTHSQNALATAAAEAVLTRLYEAGPSLQATLNQVTAGLARRVNEFFLAEDVPMMVQYFGSLFRFEPNGILSPIDQSLFVYTLRDKGIMISEIGNNFLCVAHQPAHIERLIDAIKMAVDDLRTGGYLPRRAPKRKPPLPEPPFEASQGSPRSSRLDDLLAGLELS